MLRITPYETVGRYRLLGELGQGGTATVSLAVSSGPAGFSKLVVLKKMKPQFVSEPGFAEMFLTEARLAARLNHPNIVQTNEVFEHEGLPVLVMEYLEGRSFADIGAKRAATGPFQLGHCLTVISEALSGLHYSHEATDFNGRALELVHRDVTPHNVFVTYEGQVKILDFGIAKLKDSNVNTETGVVKGKLRYIPPEQIVGDPVDRRADIYAVGVMLWEIAAGEKLWRGMSDAAVMNQVINEKIPRPSEKNPQVDPALESLIMRALSPDPAGRHRSALHLQQEVDEVRRGLPGASVRDLIPAMDALYGADRANTRKLVEVRLTQLALGVDENSGSPTSPTLKAFATIKAINTAEPKSTRSAWPWYAGLAALLASGLLWIGRASTELQQRAVGVDPRLRDEKLESESTIIPSTVPAEPRAVATDVLPARSPGPPTMASEAPQLRASDAASKVTLPPQPASRRSSETSSETRSKGARAELTVSASPATASASPLTSVFKPPSSGPNELTTCAPPFIVDGRGVKRFKRECVR